MPSGRNLCSHGVCQATTSNDFPISHSLALPTKRKLIAKYIHDLTLLSENGIATHWYPTGQPGPCQYVPEAVRYNPSHPSKPPYSPISFKLTQSTTQDPSYTVAISSGLDMKTLCGNWVVIKNTNNPDIEPLRATVTTTCTTCGENDLCKFDLTWALIGVASDRYLVQH